MKRSASILLILATWASCSGWFFIQHHADAADGVPHDESTCKICTIHHAPAMQASAPAPAIQLWTSPESSPVLDQATLTVHLSLALTCRGPPNC